MANSTSTVFAKSTLSQPNNEEVIFCVSTVLQMQMLQDVDATPDKVATINSLFALMDSNFEGVSFGESGADLDIIQVNSNVSKRIRIERSEPPTIEEIYSFIREIFVQAQYSPECNIIALVYINRIISNSHLPLSIRSWKQLLVTAINLAQKVWDDRSLGTSSFSRVCPLFTKKQLRRFEHNFLRLLDYNATISMSTYAQYYFELRTLCASSTPAPGEFPLAPMSALTGRRLELRSEMLSSKSLERSKGGGRGGGRASRSPAPPTSAAAATATSATSFAPAATAASSAAASLVIEPRSIKSDVGPESTLGSIRRQEMFLEAALANAATARHGGVHHNSLMGIMSSSRHVIS